MRKKIAKKWVKALRSGKYKQGTGSLRTIIDGEKHFCCLGVLCKISKLGKWNNLGWYFGNATFLPTEVKDWAEMKTNCGKATGYSRDLSEYNDNDNFTFEQIADLIEERWELL